MQCASMSGWTTGTLTPDGALLLCTGGLLLIYAELNRPGSIIPGALGLLGVLLAIGSLAAFHLNPWAVALVCAAAAVWMLGLMRPMPPLAPTAATLALFLGFDRLTMHGSLQVQTGVAALCALVIGVATTLLTRVARRARTNKRFRL